MREQIRVYVLYLLPENLKAGVGGVVGRGGGVNQELSI